MNFLLAPPSNWAVRIIGRSSAYPRGIAAAVLVLFCGILASANQTAEPDHFFREYVGLNDDQIARIQQGKAFAKVLESTSPDEVFVFGAVHIDSTPERYLEFASDVDSLRRLPNYLAIRKFSDPPELSDLEGFTLEADDIKDLKNCQPGHCEVQLPTEAIDEFKRSVDFSSPDAASQVNRLAQTMALEALIRYTRGGSVALGTYRDKKHPAVIAESFQSILARSQALPAYLSELDHYLLDYPNANAPNIESQFYWEKVNFGLKPTLRILQAIVFRGQSPDKPAYAVAVKQLYASHYFETALDLSVCLRAHGHPDTSGIYLITLKGSRQAGLTGFKGSIVRKVAVDKTRSSLEKALQSIKGKLESPTNGSG